MKLFELYRVRPLREDKSLTAAINLCESVVSLLEGLNDAGSFDFEPDPEYAGVKGINRDSGAGNLAAAQAEKKQQEVKLNQTWQRLIKTLKTMRPDQAQTLKANMKKVAMMAKQKEFTLSPSPEQVLGL